MPTPPPYPTEQSPGIWRTRWRSDPDGQGRRHQHTQRFYGTKKQVDAQYKRWLRAWKVQDTLQNPHLIDNFSIRNLAEKYLEHAQSWYVKNGRLTSRIWNIKSALQKLVNDFGSAPANDFTPPMLADWRDHKDSQNIAKRKTVNEWITIIRQCWDWGAERGFIDPDVALRLSKVKLLQRGRCQSGEYSKVTAVHWSVVQQTLEHLSPALAAMVNLQWLTGMRPGEVCHIRGCDINMSGSIWIYTVAPEINKTEHASQRRRVALGPKSQEIIKPFFQTGLQAYLFSPAPNGHKIGQHYTTNSYRQAIQRACDRAKLPRWSPNQLRHAKEAALEKSEGMEAARLSLGHSTATTTINYGKSQREQRELELIKELAAKYG